MTNAAPREPRNSRGSLVAEPEVREQSGEHGLMDVVGMAGGRARLHADLAGDPAQLAEQVLPLAYTQIVEVLGAAQLAELVGRSGALLGAQVVPQGDDRQEIRAGDVEPPVGFVGLGPLGEGPLARILDRQRGGDHEDLADAAVAVGFDHHPAETRVDRQAGEPSSDRCQRSDSLIIGSVDRRQLLEQQVAVADRRGVRWLDEREGGHVAEADRCHLEDD